MPTDINRSIVSMVYPACVRFTSVVAHMISQLFHLVNVSMKNVFPFIYLKKVIRAACYEIRYAGNAGKCSAALTSSAALPGCCGMTVCAI